MRTDHALTELFHQVKADQTVFTRRMAIVLADIFATSPMVMVGRLERMRLLKAGSLEWFQANGGITQTHIDQVRTEANEALAQRRERALS